MKCLGGAGLHAAPPSRSTSPGARHCCALARRRRAHAMLHQRHGRTNVQCDAKRLRAGNGSLPETCKAGELQSGMRAESTRHAAPRTLLLVLVLLLLYHSRPAAASERRAHARGWPRNSPSRSAAANGIALAAVVLVPSASASTLCQRAQGDVAGVNSRLHALASLRGKRTDMQRDGDSGAQLSTHDRRRRSLRLRPRPLCRWAPCHRCGGCVLRLPTRSGAVPATAGWDSCTSL